MWSSVTRPDGGSWIGKTHSERSTAPVAGSRVNLPMKSAIPLAVFAERLFPNINRPEDVIRDRLPVGPADRMIEKLIDYKQAG